MFQSSTHIILVVLFFVGGFITGVGQTLNSWPQTSYQKVLDVADCGKKLYVDDASVFAADDWVLLVQHKGAKIEREECPRYGKVNEYEAAGNFELLRVESVETQPLVGDDYLLLKSCPSLFYYAAYLEPQSKPEIYPLDNSFAYQIVKVHYTEGDLTINGTLEAPEWNEGTGVGGVIAIIATGKITLEADILASGAGFSGGDPNPNTTDVDQTAYETSASYTTGYKGEGLVRGFTTKNGRGAAANGGGGGGGKNAGGGGGSNYGGGGHGGDQIGTEDDPNTTADDENQKIGGVGGWKLPYDNPIRTQAFFGGGGGGGHRSQQGTTITNESKGGNGGGIVLIMAQELEVNGTRKIEANGTPGGDAEPGDNGAGGGGGGGVVLLDIQNNAITAYAGGSTLAINVNGGNGGNTDDADCTGPGGGGGGGVAWFRGESTPSVVTVNADKGNAGNTGTAGSSQGCGSHNAVDGEDGATLYNLTYPKWYDAGETPI